MNQWWREEYEGDNGEAPRWQRITTASAAALEVAANAFELRGVCESPIEVMLGAQIQTLINRTGETRITLHPQFRLENYRFDFALKVRNRPIVLIECDGAEFHSTPEQQANDQRKDEAARKAGLSLLRFSGSEINRHAESCALVALNELIQRIR